MASQSTCIQAKQLQYNHYVLMIFIFFAYPKILHIQRVLGPIAFGYARVYCILALPEKLLFDFQVDPSIQTLPSLLSSIIEPQQSLFDNSLSEGGLQHMTEASLRSRLCGRVTLEAEVTIEKGRSDLVIKLLL